MTLFGEFIDNNKKIYSVNSFTSFLSINITLSIYFCERVKINKNQSLQFIFSFSSIFFLFPYKKNDFHLIFLFLLFLFNQNKKKKKENLLLLLFSNCGYTKTSHFLVSPKQRSMYEKQWWMGLLQSVLFWIKLAFTISSQCRLNWTDVPTLFFFQIEFSQRLKNYD